MAPKANKFIPGLSVTDAARLCAFENPDDLKYLPPISVARPVFGRM